MNRQHLPIPPDKEIEPQITCNVQIALFTSPGRYQNSQVENGVAEVPSGPLAGPHQAVLVGVDDRLHAVAQAELGQHAAHVSFHRGL